MLLNFFCENRSVVEKLGNDIVSKIKVVGNEEAEQSFYGQLVLGGGVSKSLDEQLAKEARKAGRYLSSVDLQTCSFL